MRRLVFLDELFKFCAFIASSKLNMYNIFNIVKILTMAKKLCFYIRFESIIIQHSSNVNSVEKRKDK